MSPQSIAISAIPTSIKTYQSQKGNWMPWLIPHWHSYCRQAGTVYQSRITQGSHVLPGLFSHIDHRNRWPQAMHFVGSMLQGNKIMDLQFTCKLWPLSIVYLRDHLRLDKTANIYEWHNVCSRGYHYRWCQMSFIASEIVGNSTVCSTAWKKTFKLLNIDIWVWNPPVTFLMIILYFII